MKSLIKRTVRRLRGEAAPPLEGTAGPDWYDQAYRALRKYRQPYWKSLYYPLWTVIADRVRRGRAARVLDIGCGPGQLASCLFDLAAIAHYTGLDFSPQAVSMATAACPRGRFIVGDATTTSVHDEVDHDIVICTEVLEHVPADHLVIQRFKPGMRALCSVPNYASASHVRYFDGADDVAARYGRFFDDLDVWAVRVFKSDAGTFFLMDGIRNAYHLPEGDVLTPDFPPR